MHKIVGFLVFAVALFLMLGQAGAQDDAKKKKRPGGFGDPEASFKKLDSNSDNKLSRGEFLKSLDFIKDADKAEKAKQFLGKAFDKHSTDGSMSLDQFKEYRKAAADRFKKKKIDN